MYGSQPGIPAAGRSDAVTQPDDLWPPFGAAHAATGHRRPLAEAGRSPGDQGRGRAGQGLRGRDRPTARGGRGPGEGGPRRNRPTPSLTRADIVDAAIAIADAEGAEAVSMRRIAQVLRAGTMTLYWHVANKDHLLDLMLDALMGEIPGPQPGAELDWRTYLQQLARAHRAMLRRHTWVMGFLGGRPSLGPNTLLSLEGSLDTLDELGLSLHMAFDILTTVQTYVLGAVLREIREINDEKDQERWGVDPAEWQGLMAQWRDTLQRDGRFPHFVQFMDAGIDPDAPDSRDTRFEFGLDCVLDGIAARIARSAGPAAASPAGPGTDRPGR
jgi:AcrR family transcriptional regulator